MTQDQSGAGTQPASSKQSNNRWVIYVVIAAIVLLVFGYLVNGGDEDSPAADRATEVGARDVCRQFVERRLKSPSSAEFNEEQTSGGAGAYVVTGTVDSDNSFGASIRNEYACRVTYQGDGDWRLEDLQMTGN